MSQAFIRIKSGMYRTHKANGMTFALVEQYKKTAKGGYVTVANGGAFAGFPDEIRIKVDGPADYEFVTGSDAVMAVPAEVAPTQTDEERIAEIAERFEILTDMTKAAISGEIGRAHV